ncbi:MAG: RHS repeat-associated core domain-containing protein [Pyrinomonadaceae bacterium]
MKITINALAATNFIRPMFGMILTFHWLISITILLLFAPLVFAQLPEDNIRFTQGQVSDSAVMSVGVPLGNFKGRGIDLPVALSYSSAVWNIEYLGKVRPGGTGQSVVEAIYAKNSTSGWRSGLDLPVIEFPKEHDVYNHKGQTGPPCGGYRIRRVIIYMPDGSAHELRQDDLPRQTTPIHMTGTFYAVDGSRMRFEANGMPDTGTIYMPDGTRYVLGNPISQIIDRHGNTLTYDESANNRHWTDTLGRVIKNPLPATPTVGDIPYSLPGLAGVNGGLQTYIFRWKMLADARTAGAGGLPPALRYVADHALPQPNNPPDTDWNMPQSQPQNAGIFFKTDRTWQNGDNGLNWATELPTVVVGRHQTGGVLFNPVVLTEIVLPDGIASYKFSYNEYGELDKVIYPTGAYERYEYETKPMEIAGFWPNEDPIFFNLSYDQSKRKVKTRRLSENGTGNDVLEWQYIEKRWPSNFYAIRTSIIAPDGTRTELDRWPEPSPEGLQPPFGYINTVVGMVFQRRFFSSSANGLGGTLLRRELSAHDQTINSLSVNFTCPGKPPLTQVMAPRNLRPTRNVTIIFEGDGDALAQTTTFAYDTDTTHELTTGIDQTHVTTYPYVKLDNSIAQTATINDLPTGDPLKTTVTTYSADPVYRNANILGLPTSVETLNPSGTPVSRSEMSYDLSVLLDDSSGAVPGWINPNTSKRGLVTSSRQWHNISSNQFVEEQVQYNKFGSPRKTLDANGNLSQIEYNDNFTDGQNRFTYAYATKTISPVPGENGSGTSFETQTTYDFSTGLIIRATDPNGLVTEMDYNDPLLRPKKVTTKHNGNIVGGETQTDYGDGINALSRWVKVRSQITSSNWKEAKTWFDGLGRTIRTQSIDNETGDVFVDTEYDDMGRVEKVSNPYRNNEPVHWTTNSYDTAGRPWKVTSPDGAFVETNYSIVTSGNPIGTVVTVTDQAGKQRRSVTNALGQLSRVDEPVSTDLATGLGDRQSPYQQTNYSYDLLNNLLTVNQGTQTRTFTYDALSRLKSATNPESGTINYIYDNNGNLTSKTDARSITTTYAYDALNRVTSRNYSDTTPDVTYFYDNLTNAKGKLTRVSSSVSTTEYTSFDILGRMTGHKQTTDENQYTTDYTYNLAGTLIEETYPSGRKVRNTLDANGDLSMVESRKTASGGYWKYGRNFQYDAAGGVTLMQLGNGLYERTDYNTRLQPTQIMLSPFASLQPPPQRILLKLDYTYNTTGNFDNNGNILSQKITVKGDGAFTALQNYTYDELNRIKSATETIGGSQSWKQTFTYDRYGNRRFEFTTVNGNPNTTIPASNCVEAVCNPTISPNNNKLTSTGWQYDAAGNTTGDPQGNAFTYDAENKQVKVDNSGQQSIAAGTVGQYFYDGDGKRVKKIVPTSGGNEITIFVYDAVEKLIAEYSTNVASVEDAKVAYLTNDHLGSPRINTDRDQRVISRHDYHPFGEEIATSQRTEDNHYKPDTIRKQFTGYERDSETLVDYAKARYYGSNQGRFRGIDPVLINIFSIPQSWNKYVYSLNTPLSFKDPSGKWPTDIHDMLIREAFPGLSDYQIDRMQMGSFMVDFPKTVLPQFAYQHAMKSEDESDGQATDKMNNFINDNIAAAQSLNGTNKNPVPASLERFGMAMHPVMDSTSSEHTGDNGRPKVYSLPSSAWGQLRPVVWLVDNLVHKYRESKITSEVKAATIFSLRNRYRSTYGQVAVDKAIRPRGYGRWYGGLLQNRPSFCEKGPGQCVWTSVTVLD